MSGEGIPYPERQCLWCSQGTDGAILNRADGSDPSRVRPPGLPSLYEDNNAFSEAETRAAVTLTYDDGRVLSRQLQSPSSGRPQRGPGRPVQKESRELRLSPPRQASSSDYVGKGERPGKSGNKDWVFELQIIGKKGRLKA